MQQVAATRSVRQAVRMLKHISVQSGEWDEYREAGRTALAHVLQERMHGLVGNRIADLRAIGARDRRNGAYRRELLTSPGAIELAVPRSRTYSPKEVLRAYARREHWVDRVNPARFILGLSTRKVGEALLPILGERVSPATVSRVAKRWTRRWRRSTVAPGQPLAGVGLRWRAVEPQDRHGSAAAAGAGGPRDHVRSPARDPRLHACHSGVNYSPPAEHLPTRQLSHLGFRAPGRVPDLCLLESPYLSAPVPSCPFLSGGRNRGNSQRWRVLRRPASRCDDGRRLAWLRLKGRCSTD